MNFTKIKNEFPSYVHKVIYLHALRQTPLEVSLQDTIPAFRITNAVDNDIEYI